MEAQESSTEQHDRPKGTTEVFEMKQMSQCDSIRKDVRAKLEKRLVTAALPYINNVPHLGHMVGSHLPADIFARFSRMKGHDTLFVGGSDENGTPSELAARSIGVDIEHFCDVLHKEHERIYRWFEISYDKYSRTSTNIHQKMTEDFFKMIMQNGYISKETVEMFFDSQENLFLADRYVEGTCPKCRYEKASGDQCDKCSAMLTVDELINPKSKVSGSTPIKKETEHLFLDLDQLSEKLEVWINANTHWKPQVRNLALGWIKEGLRKRSITRDLQHGVRVPLPGFENKVFYVWFEAPIAYVSITAEAKPDNWPEYWHSKDSKIYHFLGKDNIPFHTIFWPGIIIAEGNTNLPYQVAGMQNLNYEGGKFSKSQKRGVFCESLPDSGIDSDVMRAYLTMVIPETADSEFRWDDFQKRVNDEIIGKFGNFVHRTLTFIQNKLGGEIERAENQSQIDSMAFESVRQRIDKMDKYLENLNIRQAFGEVIGIAEIANKYFHDAQPWKVVKTDIRNAKAILHTCASLCKTLASVAHPFLPSVSQKIWQQLGIESPIDEPGSWQNIQAMEIPRTMKISKEPTILFTKVTDALLTQYKEKMSHTRSLISYFRNETLIGEENF